MSSYINPYSDFGFKKLFGEEANKDLLIDFLNGLMPAEHQIADLTFKGTEQLPDLPNQRKSVFDIYCISKKGEHFVVEMQKARLDFFKDRSLFYATYPIRNQAQKGGNWDFRLNPVYLVAILDFEYDEHEERRKFLRSVQLKDQDGDLFYDKLHFKFVQMPLFTKSESELETHFDKWLYFLKNLSSFDEIPSILKEPIFLKAFKIAEVANLTFAQYEEYERSQLEYFEVNALKNTVFNAEARAYAAEAHLAEVDTVLRESIAQLEDEKRDLEEVAKAAEERKRLAEEVAKVAEEEKQAAEKAAYEANQARNESEARTVIELQKLGMAIEAISKITSLSPERIKVILQSSAAV